MILNVDDIKMFLDEKVALYNHPTFIESDPIQIPHQFSKKEDIEIAGFL
ncbi:TIGR02757 family protein, partial [Tenacibaculum maritimum]